MSKRTLQNLRSALFTMLVLLLITAINCAYSYAAVDDSVKRPTIDAKSAVLYSVTTDETIYTKNPDRKVSPWSTTKLMTALLVCENMELDTVVTVSEDAASLSGSTMYLEEGEKATVEQLLYGLLLESGNDAAYALAEACGGGDIDTFIDMMNAKAEELGCTNTHFVNPNGLEDEDHYTTASDFVKIAKAALDNETVYKISGTKEYHMPATNKSDARDIETHLDLINDADSGVVAGKTGYWEDDDCSVVLDYDKDGLHMILVLFQANIDTREDDDEALLEYGQKAVISMDATDPDEVVGEAKIRYGARTHLEAYPEDVVVTYPKDGTDSTIELETAYYDVSAPIEAGAEVGVCEVYCDGVKVGETKLVIKESVEKGWFPSRFYISNHTTIALAVVLVLLAIVLAVIHKLRKPKR